MSASSSSPQTYHPHPTVMDPSPNEVHNRLAAQESFPTVYRVKFDANSSSVAGDYHDNPRKVASLLKSTSNKALNIPCRSADFKTEVQWRLLLRNPDEECHT